MIIAAASGSDSAAVNADQARTTSRTADGRFPDRTSIPLAHVRKCKRLAVICVAVQESTGAARFESNSGAALVRAAYGDVSGAGFYRFPAWGPPKRNGGRQAHADGFQASMLSRTEPAGREMVSVLMNRYVGLARKAVDAWME